MQKIFERGWEIPVTICYFWDIHTRPTLIKKKRFSYQKKKSVRDKKPLHPHDFPPFNASYFLYSTLNIFRFKKLPQNTITLIHTLKYRGRRVNYDVTSAQASKRYLYLSKIWVNIYLKPDWFFTSFQLSINSRVRRVWNLQRIKCWDNLSPRNRETRLERFFARLTCVVASE